MHPCIPLVPKTNLPDHVCVGRLNAWLQDYMYIEGHVQDYMSYTLDIFKVHISIVETVLFRT